MAHAYTPGLRVAGKTLIHKVRRLPLKGEVLVEKGQKVAAEDIVARTELPGNVQPVKAASILGVHQADLKEFMLKKEGDTVVKDEPIALSKSFFGIFKSQCKSPCNGTMESISTITGQVIIREPPIPVEVDAYIDGIVTEVIPEEGVIVESTGAFIQGIFGVGGETSGILRILVDNPAEELEEKHLKGDLLGTVIVGGSRVTVDIFRKACDMGVRAVVIGGYDASDIRNLLGYDLGVAITGTEKIGATLVVTEGFGTMNMADRTFRLLKDHEGEKVSVNGATQIRAGVMRPEIVISLGEILSTDDAVKADAVLGVREGSLIRAIRAPYFGKIGQVTELPSDLQKRPSETMVRVLKVRFHDGVEATVPRANIEMIEE
ncbi:MAG: hypothetical protein KJ970_05315 [Candidatus Eisenbacteria bacterium]|uniref:KOW domain-containing protein n=1 Tax=Eiseniibacteriota bacterium TaxID=2212470 RepID=A0A948RV89_UNCEI|nr:hypothetical protein [Candidatus Eisenbacteria bacterium]MBU1947669.1 hypothetical protein [Candidatus Eisenbacteria bacterium]MBU2690329.1 hypothetical protein [Candidatus Eisenbacteria bacterium]